MSVYYNESLTHAVARRQPILICIEGINPNSEVLYNIYQHGRSLYCIGAQAALSNESSRRFLHCCRIAKGPVYLWNRFIEPQTLRWCGSNMVCANARLFKDIEAVQTDTQCTAVYIIADMSPQLLIFRVVDVETFPHNGDSAAAEHGADTIPAL